MADTSEKCLYDAIQTKDELKTNEQLLKPGVDYNFFHFDSDTNIFRTLIQLAIETKQDSVLQRLYEERNKPTKAQIDKYLQFYINHYNPSQQKQNKILFDFIISRLLYIHITSQHEPIEFDVLIAALHDYDDVQWRGQDVCRGSNHETFLRLRIYTLFQMITDLIIKPDSDTETFNILMDELVHNLETYYFLDGISRIPVLITEPMMTQSFTHIETSQPLLMTCYESIAKNVRKKIEQLEPDQEYTIPTGWVDRTVCDGKEVLIGHAVCVSFRCISKTHISIRVDNSSHLNPAGQHETRHLADGSIQIKSKILGRLRMKDVEANLDYFISLIDSVRRDLLSREAIPLIYNLTNIIQELDSEPFEHAFPFFDVQSKANCFLKCYESGSLIRFGEKYTELYEELVLCQQNNANRLRKRSRKEYGCDSNELASQFIILGKEPLPDYLDLQQRLKGSYLQHHQDMLSDITGQSNIQLTKSYIPLRFEIDEKPMELKDFFSDKDKSRVLLVADAGCGKSTLCQYVTYLWAKEELRLEQYEWVFHIKMRNLNSKYYPSQSDHYSLIDIIKTECFQGYELNHIEKLKLEYLFENPSKILWILDGCDERNIPDYLESIERKLFAKPNLLLTSRSYQTYQLRRDKEIKIQKFIDEDIENYIKNYFGDNNKVCASECWSKINSYEKLKETVQVPACLEIVCILWAYDKNIFQADMNMVELYQKMCENLLRRYLEKITEQDRPPIVGENPYPLINAIPFTYLESIAFQVTKRHELLISGEKIADIAGPLFNPVLQIGILKTKNEKASRVLEQNTYYFVHRSFQEYLCARYMIKALSSNYSEEQKREVIQFITNEKYDRDLQQTLRLFFELEPPVECSNQFWSVVDSEPRDLVGIRHCSRIIRWFHKGICGSPEEANVKHRTSKLIENWILDKRRQAHDFGNRYLFDYFGGMVDYQCWLEAWEYDLKNTSSRRYFLPDLWCPENIEVLKKAYDDLSKKPVKLLYRLIRDGPTEKNLKRLDPNLSSFKLYTINDQNTTIQNLLKEAQEKASKLQSVTTLKEFQELLENYKAFEDLNRQAVAKDKEIWALKIDPSALENIVDATLELLLQIIENKQLFYRYFELPVLPFLELYAKSTAQNDDTLRKLIVSITVSTGYILTAPPDEITKIRFPRIRENDQSKDIEMGIPRRDALIRAFSEVRDFYGYSGFFQN